MALAMFEIDIARYPTVDEGLGALLHKPQFDDHALARNWRGPYLKKMPKDAWGQQINYERVEDTKGDSRYRIWSLGPDGMSGTADDIRKWLDE